MLATDTAPLRTVYSDDHSPITFRGQTHEWDDFLDLGFAALASVNKPMDVRRKNALEREDIYTIRGLLTRTEADLMDIRNLGEKSVEILKGLLAEAGLKLLDESTAMPGFFNLGSGWQVRPDVCLRLQCRELDFLPTHIKEEYPTVESFVRAWDKISPSLLVGVTAARRLHYLDLIESLRPHMK